MIVRLMGEGQFDLPESELEGLNELDNQVVQAVEAGDEENVRRLLEMMTSAVRDRGTRLPDESLEPSELMIPPPDLDLEEAKQLFTGEGLIPDIPAPASSVP